MSAIGRTQARLSLGTSLVDLNASDFDGYRKWNPETANCVSFYKVHGYTSSARVQTIFYARTTIIGDFTPYALQPRFTPYSVQECDVNTLTKLNDHSKTMS